MTNNEKKKNEETEVISARITRPLKNLIDQYLSMDAHISIGDLIRDALREKIKKDAPHLYKQMFSDE